MRALLSKWRFARWKRDISHKKALNIPEAGYVPGIRAADIIAAVPGAGAVVANKKI
jgi:hypothetical protein